MHARATVVVADPARVDDVVSLVVDRVAPAVDARGGSLGLSLNVDRSSGRCTLTEVWADRASMHASERPLAPLREAAARVAATHPATEEYEVALLHRLRQAEVGCWVRSTRVRLDPAQVDTAVRIVRNNAVPAVERFAGFRSLLLLADRTTGSGVVSVVFDDRAALDASRAVASRVREDSSARAEARVSGVVDGEIVVARLRLPLTPAVSA